MSLAITIIIEPASARVEVRTHASLPADTSTRPPGEAHSLAPLEAPELGIPGVSRAPTDESATPPEEIMHQPGSAVADATEPTPIGDLGGRSGASIDASGKPHR